MSNDQIANIMATLARIEKRQAAYEIVAHRILTCLEVGNEKQDVMIGLLNAEAPPSETALVLKDILDSMNRQVELLEALPGVMELAD